MIKMLEFESLIIFPPTEGKGEWERVRQKEKEMV